MGTGAGERLLARVPPFVSWTDHVNGHSVHTSTHTHIQVYPFLRRPRHRSHFFISCSCVSKPLAKSERVPGRARLSRLSPRKQNTTRHHAAPIRSLGPRKGSAGPTNFPYRCNNLHRGDPDPLEDGVHRLHGVLGVGSQLDADPPHAEHAREEEQQLQQAQDHPKHEPRRVAHRVAGTKDGGECVGTRACVCEIRGGWVGFCQVLIPFTEVCWFRLLAVHPCEASARAFSF